MKSLTLERAEEILHNLFKDEKYITITYFRNHLKKLGYTHYLRKDNKSISINYTHLGCVIHWMKGVKKFTGGYNPSYTLENGMR